MSQNHMLAGLSDATLRALGARLRRVQLTTGQVLYASNAVVPAAYFPQDGLISKVAQLRDGMQVEVGLIGNEGVAGAFLPGIPPTSIVECTVQLDGTALRVETASLREAMEEFHDLREAVARQGEMMLAQAVQSASCNARHALHERLARWLLMAHDRAARDEMALTQDFLAAFLASYRPNITVAAKRLRDFGAIRYRRGVVVVVDRAALEGCACECYAVLRRHRDRLLGPKPPKMQCAAS